MQIARHWWYKLVSEVGRAVFRGRTSGLQMCVELVLWVDASCLKSQASWFQR